MTASPWTSGFSPCTALPGGYSGSRPSAGFASPSEFSFSSRPVFASGPARIGFISLRRFVSEWLALGGHAWRIGVPQGFDPFGAFLSASDFPGVFHPGPSVGFDPSGLLPAGDRGGLPTASCPPGVRRWSANLLDRHLQGVDPPGKSSPAVRPFGRGRAGALVGLSAFSRSVPAISPFSRTGTSSGFTPPVARERQEGLPTGATSRKATWNRFRVRPS